MAGIDHICRQQDGRVVKAPSFGGERTKYTPDMPSSNPAAKKSIDWADGTELRPVVTMAGIDHIFLGQQDGRGVKAPSFG